MPRLILVPLGLIVAAAALAVASPVRADPLPTCASVTAWPDHGPLRCTDDDPVPTVWDDPSDPWGQCNGFYIVATYLTQRTITDWWTNAIVQVSYSGTLANSSDRSKSLPYSGRFSKRIDYSTDPLTIGRSGLLAKVVVPHAGLVFLGSGTEVFDSFHHGPVGNLDALCAALS